MKFLIHPKIKKIAKETFVKVFKEETGNDEFNLISDIFLNYWFFSEVWIAYDEEILKMELENSIAEKAIPDSRFRLFEKQKEDNTWRSLITGVGGYLIDEKKHLLKRFSYKDFKIF